MRASLILASFLMVCGIAIAQNGQVKGVINGRSGATMSVLSQGGETITVVLTTDTQVLEPEGAFRKKHLSMTALVPGLAVEAKGRSTTSTNWSRTASGSMAQTSRPHKTSRLAWLQRNRK